MQAFLNLGLPTRRQYSNDRATDGKAGLVPVFAGVYVNERVSYNNGRLTGHSHFDRLIASK